MGWNLSLFRLPPELLTARRPIRSPPRVFIDLDFEGAKISFLVHRGSSSFSRQTVLGDLLKDKKGNEDKSPPT
jgi:hypothetical protein